MPQLPQANARLWIHTSHKAYQPAIESVACHMDAQQVDGSRQRIAFAGSGINHSMKVAAATCTACHEQAPASAETTPQAQPQEAAPHETDTSSADGNLVQLLQGLILGLDATGGAFLAVRGNRSQYLKTSGEKFL